MAPPPPLAEIKAHLRDLNARMDLPGVLEYLARVLPRLSESDRADLASWLFTVAADHEAKGRRILREQTRPKEG